jgi:hypothetical protein
MNHNCSLMKKRTWWHKQNSKVFKDF